MLKYLEMHEKFGFVVSMQDIIRNFPLYDDYIDDPELNALLKRVDAEKAALRKQFKEMVDKGRD